MLFYRTTEMPYILIYQHHNDKSIEPKEENTLTFRLFVAKDSMTKRIYQKYLLSDDNQKHIQKTFPVGSTTMILFNVVPHFFEHVASFLQQETHFLWSHSFSVYNRINRVFQWIFRVIYWICLYICNPYYNICQLTKITALAIIHSVRHLTFQRSSSLMRILNHIRINQMSLMQLSPNYCLNWIGCVIKFVRTWWILQQIAQHSQCTR